MKKLSITLAVVLLLAAGMALGRGGFDRGSCDPGFGADGPARHGSGMGHKMCGKSGPRQDMPGIHMILAAGDEINLTAEQRGKLEKMMTEFQKTRIDRQAELKKAGVDLGTLMRKDDAVESEVSAAIDKVSGLKAEMQKMKYRHRKQIKAVLTEEQLNKLKQMHKERCSKRGDMDRPGRQGGFGRGW
ncbi:MAG: Spy/CpxP family protein refolding chaperone [candidate division Zixibacteria bacterium]|nr:Spy/CpxP family protein refolding chaperone [candidate division Zixibacteria bacterium]